MSSEAERSLLAQIASSASGVLVPNHADGELQFDHCFMSTFENAFYFLNRLGCVREISGSFIRLDPPEMAFRRVFEGQKFDQITLEMAIFCFLSLADHRGLPLLTRHTFTRPKQFDEVLIAFAKAGFGIADNDDFKWSDEIVPFMWNCYIWKMDDPSEKPLARKFVEDMADTRPSHVDQDIRDHAREFGVSASGTILCRDWAYRRWLTAQDDKDEVLDTTFNPLRDEIYFELVERLGLS